ATGTPPRGSARTRVSAPPCPASSSASARPAVARSGMGISSSAGAMAVTVDAADACCPAEKARDPGEELLLEYWATPAVGEPTLPKQCYGRRAEFHLNGSDERMSPASETAAAEGATVSAEEASMPKVSPWGSDRVARNVHTSASRSSR